MSSIVVCGGGGKTTIARKYPSLFVDIDDFVWSPVNQDHHRQLEHACETKNVAVIQTIYRGIMEKHATHLANCGKIIHASPRKCCMARNKQSRNFETIS